jgi:hypothetical protein
MLNDKEYAAVLALPGQERYGHFVKRVVDREELWGLRSADGWLLLADDQGRTLLPVWPADRYALAYRDRQGGHEQLVSIALEEWLEVMLPRLEQDEMDIAVFPLPEGKGVVITPSEHRAHLHHELQRYA